MQSSPSPAESVFWSEPLTQFARVSGLTVALYGVDRRKLVRNLCGQSLSKLLEGTGFFDGGKGAAFELELVDKTLATREASSAAFAGVLPVFSFPLSDGPHLYGVVVVGWAFEIFPDPISCARLANLVGVPENRLWLSAREQAPVGGDRRESLFALLKTWNQALVTQLVSAQEIKKVSVLKDQFLAIASHELRTPLTSILLRSQSLVRFGNNLSEKDRQTISSIERSAKIQQRLVDDLLETSRLMNGKLTLSSHEYRPADLCTEAYEVALPEARRKNIALSLKQGDVGAVGTGDPIRLQQVFWNLVNNAVKFTPPDGRVDILSDVRDGAFQFSVRDTGRGLTADEIEHLFKPFYQAIPIKHGDNSGLGLGLSIAKAVIDLHGGSISVASEGIGRGATFTVQFPLALSLAQFA